MATDSYGRDNCGGPGCKGAKARIAGSYIARDEHDRITVIVRLCADCVPLVAGATLWTVKGD